MGFRYLIPAILLVAASANADSVIRRGTSAEAPTLDPVIAAGTLAAPIINDLFEGLLGKDAALRPIPGSAESWEISPDGLTYTFRLRPNLQWSDGVPLTANDFVYGFRRLVSPAVASPMAGQFFLLKNARDIVTGKLPPEKLGVSAPDPRTVVLRLSEPAPWFIDLVGALVVSPVPEHVVEKYGNDWTRADRMVTNGPYTLAERVPQTMTRLRKNPRYHAAASVHTEVVEWYPTQDLGTSLRRFQAGELDQVLNFPPDEIERLQREMPDSLRIAPSLGVYYLVINLRKPQFADPRVRLALSLAIDREGLTGKLLRTGVKPVFSLVGSNFTGYAGIRLSEEALAFSARQAEARRLLAAAGFGPGKPLTFEYVYDTNEENRKIAVALAAMWQAVGVKALPANVDFGQLNRQVRTRSFEVARWSYFASFNDPYALLQLYAGDNTSNYVSYRNPEYDRLLALSNTVEDPAARYKILAQAETILIRDAPIIPIFDYVRRYLVAPTVRGWVMSERGPTPSRFLTVDRPPR
ncbi:MAG: peptide ABC transporter substrate-binding protein [Gammaproteobacteria bacterium]|nr:peptide ABC transporter substrate-binding protein [Gammaproteobacteria bacterium]